MNDDDCMREALKEAEKALHLGEWPIGCVIELDGTIISRAHATVKMDRNRNFHAELNAINLVSAQLFGKKQRATIYTTHEPCPMCLGSIVQNRIKRVVFGVDSNKSGATDMRSSYPAYYSAAEYDLQITGGVLERECLDIILRSKYAAQVRR